VAHTVPDSRVDRPLERWAARTAPLLALACLAACAHRSDGAQPGDLRLSTNEDVRWESDGPREVALVIENAGSRKIALREPAAGDASVAVFEPNGTTAVCRHDPAPAHGRAGVIDLAPRERRALVVHLDGCALPAGEYRYEASVVVPKASKSAWAGSIGPERGRIVVEGPPAGRPGPAAAMPP
jgi:hypothetical protein